jgi:hypothetical protein
VNTSSRRIEINSNLLLTSPEGANIHVSGDGNRLDVDLDPKLLSWKSRRQLLPRATRSKWLAVLQGFLRSADLSLAVSVRGIPIAELDGAGQGTWSDKLLGWAPMRLHLSGLLRALWVLQRQR